MKHYLAVSVVNVHRKHRKTENLVTWQRHHDVAVLIDLSGGSFLDFCGCRTFNIHANMVLEKKGSGELFRFLHNCKSDEG